MDRTHENRQLNNAEIRDGKTVLESRPRRMVVTLSTRCNARCIMCEVRHSSWDIPASTLREIKAWFPYLESVAWQGGEVFFLDFFAELFDAALEFPHLHQTVVSNGLLLNEKWIEKIASANMELALSIDGVTPEVYEKIRAGSKFDRLFANVRALNEARKRVRSNLSLRMHTVVMRSNMHQIEDFVDLAKENGFDALHMMPIWGGQEIDENIFLPGNEAVIAAVREKMRAAGEKAKKAGLEFLNSLPLGGGDRDTGNHDAGGDRPQETVPVAKTEQLCYLPWQQLNIDPGGGVRPGCLCARPAGLLKDGALEQLWNGELMQTYRKMVLGGGKGWCGENCVSGKMPIELRKI